MHFLVKYEGLDGQAPKNVFGDDRDKVFLQIKEIAPDLYLYEVEVNAFANMLGLGRDNRGCHERYDRNRRDDRDQDRRGYRSDLNYSMIQTSINNRGNLLIELVRIKEELDTRETAYVAKKVAELCDIFLGVMLENTSAIFAICPDYPGRPLAKTDSAEDQDEAIADTYRRFLENLIKNNVLNITVVRDVAITL